MEKKRILIVDDDENIAELISLYLMKECFDTEIAENGEDAIAKFQTYKPHLILLDIMLPGMDGYDVCREIRKDSTVPIIMLSAKGEVFDKVLGLKIGADDYMVKPFDSNELVARVQAILRRTVQNEELIEQNEIARNTDCVQYEGLKVDMNAYTVEYAGHIVDMPPKEMELLYFLSSQPNQVFTREQLLDRIWGYDYIGDTRTVDVHVKRLREKIGDDYNWSIATVWGIGYKFEVK